MSLEKLSTDSLAALSAEIDQGVAQVTTLNDLEEMRVRFLGKKGVIPAQMQLLGQLPPEERKEFGQRINQVKERVVDLIEHKKTILEKSALEARLQSEQIDITLPVRTTPKGSVHPISQVIEEITNLFALHGFAVAEGPDIEDDFHNFSALNIPPHHPAREMQDTFYLSPNEKGEPVVLRTHTSPVQIRTMLAGKPPFKIIAPGRVYRSDYDLTHTPMFHQVEGLLIDKNIHMGHLKSCIIEFLKAFFEMKQLPIRFRPSFFPFTEPSAEVDIGCARSREEIKIGEGKDWLEVLGCGMVHPNVLRNVGLDPEEYQGFAFGLGVERLAMLKYGIPDLRTFFDADARWLSHYNFAALDIPSLTGGLSR